MKLAQAMETPREQNSLTPSQQRAVTARDNVLVMAGAGTGKTRTLVARCLNLVCDEGVSLDKILIVTFTEAAATEMRQRLRSALEKKSRENPDAHFAEQLALFDIAHIGTLHSFCFKLVREHFYKLGLDPQLVILDEGQTRLLADEMLDEQIQSHYEGEDEFSAAVQELIQIYGDGRDEKIRGLVLHLHHYMQARADAKKWLAEQLEMFSTAEPKQWREWFAEAIADWRGEWLPVLESVRDENSKAGECLEILKSGSPDFFQKILAADADWPRGTKRFREPLKGFFESATFLNSLVTANGSDPLAEDWNWIRNHMRTLLRLTREFSETFSTRKRDDGVLDFHDLEQFALKLLWNFETEKPTEIAGRWREKLRFIFVDEYQDINAAQDKIIAALSGEGTNANRFLVGDVKQSIYRFRLADPKIFRGYAKDWRGENGQTIPLTENFRSREPLLNFVNSFFTPLMRENIGGIDYDDEAKLVFGSPATQAEFSVKDNPLPRAELLLHLKKSRGEISETESEDESGDLQESEKEARMLALRLCELKQSGHPIWDDEEKVSRAVEWRDMAILLRAPSGKAEMFAKQFERAGIPLLVERGGFYNSSEILDLLSLLQLLDNPLQDVPCIAILRSPFVNLSLDELAEIRLLANGHFWFALNQVPDPKSEIRNETREKVGTFLECFSRWRRLAQQSSLSQCLEEILAETHYDDWLLSRPRGTQRHANVRQFLNLADKFDQFQRQGLFRFLRFVEAQREIEAEPEVAPMAEENAVRLMSIHQSKGLEFPVVVVADLAKHFNEQDLRGEIILDETFGLCPRVKPPAHGGRYPSLAHWLAQKNQRRELRGEELRLLYVALTRARDTLILSASVSENKWKTIFENRSGVLTREILSAKSCVDWLGLWFGAQNPNLEIQNSKAGELPHLRWRIVDDLELAEKSEFQKPKPEMEWPSALDASAVERLREVLNWQYPHDAATRRAAKTSVTALRRQADESDDEAEQRFSASSFRFLAKHRAKIDSNRKLKAADVGTAHHKFLQHFSFEIAPDLKSFKTEAKRLEKENYLSADECAVLNLNVLEDFWGSKIGREIRVNAAFVKRELPFTAKFSPRELDEILGIKSAAGLEDEFVVVQGVVDLAVLLPKEIWLVDFKTDEMAAKDLPEKTKLYAPQLKLYARALEKIYLRPVTHCWLHFLTARRTEKIQSGD